MAFVKSTKSCKVASKTAKLAPKPPKLAPRCSQVSLKTANLASETAQDGPKILQLGFQGCFPGAAQERAGVSRDYLRSLSSTCKNEQTAWEVSQKSRPGGGSTK